MEVSSIPIKLFRSKPFAWYFFIVSKKETTFWPASRGNSRPLVVALRRTNLFLNRKFLSQPFDAVNSKLVAKLRAWDLSITPETQCPLALLSLIHSINWASSTGYLGRDTLLTLQRVVLKLQDNIYCLLSRHLLIIFLSILYFLEALVRLVDFAYLKTLIL